MGGAFIFIAWVRDWVPLPALQKLNQKAKTNKTNKKNNKTPMSLKPFTLSNKCEHSQKATGKRTPPPPPSPSRLSS